MININKRKIIGIILVIVILMSLYLYWGNTSIESTQFTIENSKIPKSFDGFTIVQVSDLHNARFGNQQERLMQAIREASPDIIVITGDLIDSNRTNVNQAMEFVNEAVKITSVYYVTGNHEARSVHYKELKEKLIKAEVTILDNESRRLERNNEFIQLTGIGDPKVEDIGDMIRDDVQIDVRLKRLIEGDKIYSILLSHRPELFKVYIENNVDLVFTGHAHGGQIRLPFIGGLVAPNQGVLPKYSSGIYEEKESIMLVSRGLGNSVFPLRINNRPQVIVATLKTQRMK